MTGLLYIDGLDMFQEYGVFITEGGHKGIVSFPPLKSVEYNNWPEEDGIEPNLSETHLDSKSFSISFGCVSHPNSEQFISFLSDGAYHDFDFRQLGVVRKLRLDAQPSRESFDPYEVFALSFVDDFPLEGYEYVGPLKDQSVWQKGYELDNKPLSDYGVWILEGSDDEIMKSPAVKKNLLIKTVDGNGTIYDGEQVVYQHKDAKLNCFINMPKEVFWRNYNALLFDLSKPGERLFYFEKRAEEIPCYYKSSEVTELSISGSNIWCVFTLTLSFFSFRVGEIDYLLASESGDLIITEDEEFYIDVQNYGNQ